MCHSRIGFMMGECSFVVEQFFFNKPHTKISLLFVDSFFYTTPSRVSCCLENCVGVLTEWVSVGENVSPVMYMC